MSYRLFSENFLRPIIPSMQQIKRTFGFSAVVLILALLGGWLLAQLGYNESFLVLNKHNTPLLDFIMPHYTHLGDGVLMSVLLGLLWIPHDKALVVTMTLALLCVAIITAQLKFEIFNTWHRPPSVFAATSEVVHYLSFQKETMYSFPSGHSMAAICMGFFWAIALGSSHKLWHILVGIIAASVCYSRVYIGVHFLGDIVVGGLLGLLIAATAYLLLYTRLTRYFASRSPKTARIWAIGLYALGIGLLVYDVVRLGAYY